MATTAEQQASEEHENPYDHSTESEDEPEPESVPFLSRDNGEQSRRSSTQKPIRPTLLSRMSYLSYTSVSHASRVAASQILSIKILWPFVPLGLVAGYFEWTPVLTSAFNFLAIIPLCAVGSDASDELSDLVGDLWGALINATFGNAVELIVGILAVYHEDPAFAQSVMIGSILSDILFVFGACLFSSAWRAPILKLNTAVSGALSSLMIITAVALILPTVLYSTFDILSTDPTAPDFATSEAKLELQILSFSRGTAFVLLVLYVAYLHFEFSRKDLFDPQPIGSVHRHDTFSAPSQHTTIQISEHEQEEQEEEEEGEEGNANPRALIKTSAILISAAAGIMFCAHFLLNTIDATSALTHITRTFIATILVPITSNATECATVIASSRNGRIDFAVAVIVSSILQIALFVVPVLVLLGWALGRPMTLNFDTFQTITLFLAVVLVNHLLMNGKYTYMHGLTLVALYAVMAVAFFLRNDI